MSTEIVPSDDLAWGGQCIITAYAGSGGSISPCGVFSAPVGSEISFVLEPDPGYIVESLLVNGVVVSRSQTYTLTVYQDSEVVATFSPLPVISASAGDHGSIIPEGDILVYPHTDMMFWIIPEPNYRIQEVTVDGETIGAVGFYVFEDVTTNHTIHAEFTAGAGTHTITATAGSHGYIIPSGVIEVTDGQSISFIIWPDDGYHIDYVLVDGVSVGACSTYTFTNVTSDHSIHAEFTEGGTYTITATAGTHGTIVPSGVVTVKANSSVSFFITPDEDYCISSVIVDGISVGAVQTYSFTNVTSDHSIHAEFYLCAPGDTIHTGLQVYPGRLVRWATGQLWCVAVCDYDLTEGPKLSLFTSTDNGSSWTRVSLPAAIEGVQFRPDIAIDSQGTLHLVWENKMSGTNPEYSNIQYISRTLSGEWSALEWLSSELFDQDHPHIAVDANDNVHVIWTGKTIDYPDGKVIQHRVLVGGTWSATEVIYHDDTYDGLTPDLAISGLTVLAAWAAGIDNQQLLYTRKYTDSWGEVTQITGKGYTHGPDVMYSVDGATVGIVCTDIETSTYHVYKSLNLNPLVRVDTSAADEYTNAWPSLSIGISYGCHIFWAGKGWGNHPDSYNIVHEVDGVTTLITNDMRPSYAPNPLCKDAPVVDSVRIDRPLQGFALTWVYNQSELRYYRSPDLRWEHPVGYYEIIATSEGGGDVIPPGASYVVEGGSLAYSIVPHQYHKIDDVQVDGTSIGITTHYTFVGVTQDHTIHAKFSRAYHTILATAGEHGSINPAGEVEVAEGTDISFDIIPDEGYQIDYVLVDGLTTAPLPTIMFCYVVSDHTIHAEFTEGGPYTITATAGTHGVIVPSGTVTVAANACVTFQMIPESGYRVSQVIVDGNDVTPVLSYTFLNVRANHTIHVNFDKGTLPIPIVIDKDAAFGRFYSARSSSGVLWVTYTKRVGGVNQIFVAQSHDCGATWSVEAITDSSYDQTDPVMVIDSSDTVYVVWRGKGWGNNPDKFNLVCRRNVRGVWEDAVAITDMPHNQLDPDISLDGDDRVFVVWNGRGYGTYPTTSNIYMMTYSEGSWSDIELVTNEDYFQNNPRVTVDPDGNVYIMWSGYGWGTHPNRPNIKLRIKNKDTGWSSVLDVTDDENFWFSGSIVSDLAGTIHLAWWGGSGDLNIYYCSYSKESGLSSVETITSKEPSALQVDPALGVDADNKVYLFWTGLGWPACDLVYNLRSKVKSGGTWSDFLTTDLMSHQRKPHLLSNVFPVVRNARTNFPKTGLFITWYGSLNGYNGATWDEPELELDHLHIQDVSTRKPKPVTGITEIDEEYVQTVALQFYPLRYLLKGANLSAGQKSEFITTTRMNYGLITLAFSDAGASANIRLVRRDQSGVESYSDLITISALNITSGGKYKGVERVEKLYGAHSIAVYVESITSGTVDVWLAAA
ncbi:hypothetical protein DRO59_00115 [Candidatus Bathyarchaeota archaeon]|nr:MAG: hypothetical protein DRO59_00115 [Candidatus Bathyarchaeota archaeon]